MPSAQYFDIETVYDMFFHFAAQQRHAINSGNFSAQRFHLPAVRVFRFTRYIGVVLLSLIIER